MFASTRVILSVCLFVCIGYSFTDAAAIVEPRATEVIGGFVLYRNLGGKIEYLLLEKADEADDWTGPKGHVEGHESQLDAALRETVEETGLVYPGDYRVTIEFSQSFEYETNDGDLKIVWLYPAELLNFNKPIVINPEEHSDYRWLSYSDASDIIKKQYRVAFEVVGQYIEG